MHQAARFHVGGAVRTFGGSFGGCLPCDRGAFARVLKGAPPGKQVVLFVDAVNEVDGIQTRWNRFRAMERLLIVEALQRYHGNRKLAAKCLGINPSTLYRKMRSMDIRPPGHDGRYRQ